MNDPVRAIKRQKKRQIPARAPAELRDAVLSDVRRELVSARWDRRLSRTAAMMLIVGTSLNFALLLRDDRDFAAPRSTASEGSLVRTAVGVARVTDIETARQLANQISALNGHVLTAQQVSALDAVLAEELAKGRKG